MTEPTRPETPPAYGAETAQAVLNIVKEYPQLFNQSFWEFNTLQGMQRCIGGWAQWLHDGEVVLTWGDEPSNFVQARATTLLGIEHGTAQRLFHDTTKAQAIKALEYLARGEAIDWSAIR